MTDEIHLSRTEPICQYSLNDTTNVHSGVNDDDEHVDFKIGQAPNQLLIEVRVLLVWMLHR